MADAAETGGGRYASCAKVVPQSSLAPFFKFALPARFVRQHLSHLVGSDFTVTDDTAHWDVYLLQRDSRGKSEFFIQGWKSVAVAHRLCMGDEIRLTLVSAAVLHIAVSSRLTPASPCSPLGLKETHPPPASGRAGELPSIPEQQLIWTEPLYHWPALSWDGYCDGHMPCCHNHLPYSSDPLSDLHQLPLHMRREFLRLMDSRTATL